MTTECDECLYSYSTSTPATTKRGGYAMCKACAADYDQAIKAKKKPAKKPRKRKR